MALDRTKYDIELNGQGFLAASMVRQSAPDFVPRFNTGEQGENDLDLLRSKSLVDFEGGMFQNQWDDDKMTFFIKNGVFNTLDKFLYPTPVKEQLTSETYGSSYSSNNFTAWCIFDGDLLFTYRVYDSGWKNAIRKIEANGTVSNLTLPAALQSADAITDLHVWKEKVYIGTGNGAGSALIHTYDGSTVAVSVGKGTLFATLGNKLYLINDTANLWLLDETVPQWNKIGYIGDKVPATAMHEYQQRIYMAKPEGLYAYDGIQPYKVLESEGNTNGFQSMVEYHGWLYMLSNNKLSRFNGVTYEKLFDLSDLGDFNGDLVSTNDRLYMVASVTQEIADSGGGKPGSSTLSTTYGLFYWDDVGLYCYNQFSVANTTTPKAMALDGNPVVGVNASDVNMTAYVYKWDKGKEFGIATGSNTYNDLEVITSIHNGGYPNVPKELHIAEADFLISDDVDIDVAGTLYVKTKDVNGEWGSWTSVGVITDKTETKIQLATTQTYYEQQLKFLADSSNNHIALKRLSFRFTINPRRRMRWRATMNIAGNSDLSTIKLRDGSSETKSAKELREVIYAAHRSNSPIWFYEYDHDQLNADITDVATTITLKYDTSLFPDEGVIRIGTELIRYSSKTGTQLTVVERGAFGTTAAAHLADATVEIAYRTYIESIAQDRISLDSNTVGTTESGVETELTLDIVEV